MKKMTDQEVNMMNGKTFVIIMVVVLLVIGAFALVAAELLNSLGSPDSN